MPRDRGGTLSPYVVPALSRDPYAAAEVVRARWWTALLQQQSPVIMGPGVRRDDIGALRRIRPQHPRKPAEHLVDDGPEQQHDRERGNRADQAVRPEHLHVAAGADHRQA